MVKYILKRLFQMVITLLISSILVFILANCIGDPVNMIVSPKAPPEVREQVREMLGLNKPIWEQYITFVSDAIRGDFGDSYIYKEDVLGLILQRAPATLELVFVSVILALVISIPLGVYAGAFPKRKSSSLIMGGSILGISLPTFFIGIVLIFVFSLLLGWLPSSGRGPTATFLGMKFSLFVQGGLKYIILPAVTLSVTNIASLVRLTRAGVMENMRQDYIKFARAKGVSTRPCSEKRSYPGHYGIRNGDRFPDRLYHCNRDHLFLARSGKAADRFHQLGGSAGDRGLPVPDDRAVRVHQLCGRSALHDNRSQNRA